MKKVLAFFITFIILCFFASTYNVSAENTAVSAKSVVNIGDVFTLTFSIECNEPMYALEGTVEFDSTAISVENSNKEYYFVESLNELSTYTKTVNCKALSVGIYTIKIKNINYVPNSEIKTGLDDCFCTVKIIDTSLPENEISIIIPDVLEYPLNSNIDFTGGLINYYSYGVFEETASLEEYVNETDTTKIGTKTVTATYNNAVSNFRIIIYDPDNILNGDINSDGNVNSADLVRFKKYLAGQSVPILSFSSDLNGDSEINSKDFVRLKRRLSGQNV